MIYPSVASSQLSVLCFCDCAADCVFVLINSVLLNLYVFGSCFKKLAVILVSDFSHLYFEKTAIRLNGRV